VFVFVGHRPGISNERSRRVFATGLAGIGSHCGVDFYGSLSKKSSRAHLEIASASGYAGAAKGIGTPGPNQVRRGALKRSRG